MKGMFIFRYLSGWRATALALSVLVVTVSGTGVLAKEPDPKRPKENGGQSSPVFQKGKEGSMNESNQITEEEGKQLLAVARKTIEARLFGHKEETVSDIARSKKFLERRGTFVTLTMNRNLRGCIGHIVPQGTLLEGVRVNAINAAFRDPRFRPLSKEEWAGVKIEVSVLTDPQELNYSGAEDLLKKLRAGVDGVILKKGYNQATFLPQVWDQLPDKKEFLTHLCMKAGLEGDAWKRGELEVSTYQVQAFEE